jgi:hypothetical protein
MDASFAWERRPIVLLTRKIRTAMLVTMMLMGKELREMM